jgi:pimeloyl-ACP methyl ester carboxylesterase
VPTPTPLPQGKVSVGDHDIFYRCAGVGSPTVVVEDGATCAGASDHSWDAVAAEVQKVTRICVYDRPPLGLSRGDIKVRASNEVAQDLHGLLLSAHLAGPYVLVGHSMGGLYVRSYQAQYPQEVVGMILVDAVSPDFYSRFVAALPPVTPNESKALAD